MRGDSYSYMQTDLNELCQLYGEQLKTNYPEALYFMSNHGEQRMD